MGARVGNALGRAVGPRDGRAVGARLRLGCREGKPVGVRLGNVVGRADGRALGKAVGLRVVGARDGSFVGAGLGYLAQRPTHTSAAIVKWESGAYSSRVSGCVPLR